MSLSSSRTGLKRELGFLDTTFLVVGSILGSGIFLTTGIIAGWLSSPLQVLLVWFAGGLITLCGALTFGELGGMFPEAGGQYIYLREAYGSLSGFLYGWSFFWVIECGGVAALAVGFSEYLSAFVPALSSRIQILAVQTPLFHFVLTPNQLVAVSAIAGLSFINARGLRLGADFQNFFTILRIAAASAFILAGIFLLSGRSVPISSLFGEWARPEFRNWGLALVAVLWAYDGWYSASCTAGEIKNPGVNLPRGLLAGTGLIMLVYLLLNLVYLQAVPISDLAGRVRVGEIAAERILGPAISPWMTGVILITIFGCLSANILYGPRVFYAMARDRLFFRRMAFIHPKHRVPTQAILWQAVWSCILCFSGRYQDLFEYVIFALVFFFAATGAAVFILRRRKPDAPRPYRVPLFPLIPALFILVNVGIFLNTIWSQPFRSLLGLVIILAGIPAFLIWKKRSSLESPPPGSENEKLRD